MKRRGNINDGGQRRQLELVRMAKRAARSGGFTRFRVKEFGDYPDSIVCRTWDGVSEGASDVHVGKPWDCRRTPFDRQIWDGVEYTYSGNLKRSAKKGGITETQVLVPAYLLDCEINAFREVAGGTGANVPDGKGSSTAVLWQEFSARAFAAEDQGSLLGTAASGGLVIGGVQHNVAAERDPGADDDERAGYAITSLWVNVLSGAMFGCVSAAPGAAVWRNLSSGVGAVISFIIDGGGSVITTGLKGDLEIPFACTITQWTILADQSGTIGVGIWKDSYANFPPLVGDLILTPALSGAAKAQTGSLSVAVAAGDILRFNADSSPTIANVTRVTVSLKVLKT
jgi:hypothetical protein